MNLPELLAPAGDRERMRTAFDAGADAAYVAGTRHSLRKQADNFSLRELDSAIQEAHKRGKKVFITCNAYPLERDVDGLAQYLKALDNIGPDALIIADHGVFALAKELTSIDLHVSTQATVLNSASARYWKRAGATRVVVGRELSMDECHDVATNANIEVETFIHGSMCTSHSGKCVISNYTAGRDANRGGCMQACRNPYTIQNADKSVDYTTTFMNSKDLNSLSLIPEIAARNIASLKIEGRMKGRLYVASAVAAYRLVLDACDGTPAQMTEALEKARILISGVSNREFTTGSLEKRAFSDSLNNNFGGYQAETEYVGDVIGSQGEQSIIEWKDSVNIGSILTIQQPDGTLSEISLQECHNLRGDVIERSKPNSIGLAILGDKIPARSIIRRDKSKQNDVAAVSI